MESLIQSQVGDINKYFTPNIVESKNVAENLVNEEEYIELNDDEKVFEFVNMDEMGNNEEILEPLIVEESNFSEKNDEKNKIGIQLANEGYNDWHNLSSCLIAHEAIKEHMECMTDWLELERRLQKNQTIDAKAKVQLKKEKEHRKHVLHRIISIVQRLAKNNLAVRESCEKLYVENNGLFLQMIEMIAEFYPIMKEHLRHISHKEQMSLVIRCLDESENSTKVKEYWIEFLEVDDMTGQGLFMHFKDSLINLGLDIDDVQGQGYDNGSNMKEKLKGVQKSYYSTFIPADMWGFGLVYSGYEYRLVRVAFGIAELYRYAVKLLICNVLLACA
ncbi:uncharacterized protein [Henckelia pumila]|uniref:uncharacterized protein n=1 Tax=Henckelia pumila TaxID=405737 RepID=UPI003C6E56E3